MVESFSMKAFRQTSPTLNSQTRVAVEGLVRSSPALSSVNVINRIHSYLLRSGRSLLGVDKRQKGPRHCFQKSNGAYKALIMFSFD